MVTIESDNNRLLRVFKPLQVMYDEGLLKFTKEGITCLSVNPSHTSMLKLTVKKEYFKQYKIKEDEEFGIDIAEFISILEKKTFKKRHHKTKIEMTPDRGYANINIESKIDYKGTFNLVDRCGMREPKIPNLTLDWGYEIFDMNLLKDICLDIKNSGFEHIKLHGDTETLMIKYSPKYSNDENTYILKSPEVKNTKSEDIGFTVTSLFPLFEFNYIIWGFTQTFGKNVHLSIETGTDYPLKITAEDEHITLMYLLAPRIESY